MSNSDIAPTLVSDLGGTHVRFALAQDSATPLVEASIRQYAVAEFTSFSAAALGAEGVAADVTMLIGNGYVPGHAELALGLLRSEPGVRALFEARLTESG